ncbi:DUF4261 domain-containing protein [soil metagenome]
MPKGLFTQCVCLLTDGTIELGAIRVRLEDAGFRVAKELAASDNWEFAGPSFIVPYRPEVNGSVSIDVVNCPWPDEMGSPKSGSMAFAAWSMGFFGPFAYPGGLERAVQHAWNWPTGRNIAPKHQGVIRMRVSYVGGQHDSAPVLPDDYDAAGELQFLNRLVLAVGTAPGILCYFNPNGEALRDLNDFRLLCEKCALENKLSILLWSNARFFKVDAAFGFMDTIGNGQLDVQDIEVIYPSGRYDARTIEYYMRYVTHYLLGLDRELQTGESIDGPGESALSWVIESRDESLVAPPRRVLRLSPAADAAAIRVALAAAGRG